MESNKNLEIIIEKILKFEEKQRRLSPIFINEEVDISSVKAIITSLHSLKVTTSFKRGGKIQQTGRFTRRSLGDIYRTVRYYFPTTTLDEVLNILYTEGNGYGQNYCGAVKKRVYSRFGMAIKAGNMEWYKNSDEIGLTLIQYTQYVNYINNNNKSNNRTSS